MTNICRINYDENICLVHVLYVCGYHILMFETK